MIHTFKIKVTSHFLHLVVDLLVDPEVQGYGCRPNNLKFLSRIDVFFPRPAWILRSFTIAAIGNWRLSVDRQVINCTMSINITTKKRKFRWNLVWKYYVIGIQTAFLWMWKYNELTVILIKGIVNFLRILPPEIVLCST